jgi:hypothetical protein
VRLFTGQQSSPGDGGKFPATDATSEGHESISSGLIQFRYGQMDLQAEAARPSEVKNTKIFYWIRAPKI